MDLLLEHKIFYNFIYVYVDIYIYTVVVSCTLSAPLPQSSLVGGYFVSPVERTLTVLRQGPPQRKPRWAESTRRPLVA